MKRLSIISFILLITFQLQAQEKERSSIGGRPNITGDLFLDFGFNMLNNRPEDLNTRFIASRVFNVYYQTQIPLGQNTGFTFNPGIGLGLEKLAFKDEMTLVSDPDKSVNSSMLTSITNVYGQDASVSTNTMALNYFDIPLEFRYHVNHDDYDSGIRVAVGGKIGLLYNAHTKIAYTNGDGLEQKIKNAQNYGLNPIRYGVYTRLGFPGFNVWGYYGLNGVFEGNQGPYGTESTQFNFGVSVALF
ncbi:porin family protein [Cyclobacterium sp. 1_MG-2023]|uniref:porin family protein n=1 Tax=Cyclobacterium sp. 1_MG-2023 TaxID=3062681 RepID=UPI0026E2F354|nr:porin family protein [Cyclobacterium sp. 1_MG-2023]MDO6438194.1 porin family protein [Cyclobacterium sp. 1_MG-2023]